MNSRRRRTEVSQQFTDRRRREDEAPRLRDEVPRLASLALTLVERRAAIASGAGHIRRVVVDRAPALFVVPCSAPGCEGGTHDLTRAVMAELRLGSARFEGEHGCDACACVLAHVGGAEYR